MQFNNYKGNRIRVSDKHLLYHAALGCLFPVFLLVLLCFHYSMLRRINWQQISLLQFDASTIRISSAYLTVSILTATAVCGALAYIAWYYVPDKIKQLQHRQKLCRMILENGWFESQKVQDSGFFKDLPSSKEKEKISYFPKFYYRMENGYLHILVEITMGKYQDQLLRLEKKLESGLYCELTSKELKDGFVEYILLYDTIGSRITIVQAQAQDGKLRLMENVWWEYDTLPHMLIAGGTGGGKTYFILTLIESLLRTKATGRCVQPANIKKIHDIIRCALNRAILWEYLDTKMRNPASMATLPSYKKNKRVVWDDKVFKKALTVVDDDLLELSMNLAFSGSSRIGEIAGLTWDCMIIDDEAIEQDNARIIINKELTRVSLNAMQALNEKDIIKIFPTQKPSASTRLVLKTPKTESSNRVVWLPRTVALQARKLKQSQDEMKEFLGDGYHDYNLVVALDNGHPVESKILRDRFHEMCEVNGFEKVAFHSLRHLSTRYKLKMTNGDVKSVQGDTGHTEAEMVVDVYSSIIDEDRKLNAAKMEKQFYETLDQDALADETSKALDNEALLLEMLKTISPETKEKLIRQMLSTS